MNDIAVPNKNGDYRYHCACGQTSPKEKFAIDHTLDGHEGIMEVFAFGKWRKSGVRWGDISV